MAAPAFDRHEASLQGGFDRTLTGCIGGAEHLRVIEGSGFTGGDPSPSVSTAEMQVS